MFTVQPDLILLDCGEESVNELTLCQKIRNLYSGPLVLLSRQENEQFILLALKLGADISLPAQNSALIIAANIKSLLQRVGSFSSFALQFGELTIDSRKKDAFLFGERVNGEELLALLSDNGFSLPEGQNGEGGAPPPPPPPSMDQALSSYTQNSGDDLIQQLINNLQGDEINQEESSVINISS